MKEFIIILCLLLSPVSVYAEIYIVEPEQSTLTASGWLMGADSVLQSRPSDGGAASLLSLYTSKGKVWSPGEYRFRSPNVAQYDNSANLLGLSVEATFIFSKNGVPLYLIRTQDGTLTEFSNHDTDGGRGTYADEFRLNVSPQGGVPSDGSNIINIPGHNEDQLNVPINIVVNIYRNGQFFSGNIYVKGNLVFKRLSERPVFNISPSAVTCRVDNMSCDTDTATLTYTYSDGIMSSMTGKDYAERLKVQVIGGMPKGIESVVLYTGGGNIQPSDTPQSLYPLIPGGTMSGRYDLRFRVRTTLPLSCSIPVLFTLEYN